MMEIRTLEHTPVKVIYECFIEAFANYVIPLQFNEAMTMERWKLAAVDYQKSYGAFDGEQLVGFIIQLTTSSHLYNFGTGVIPSYRGQKLVQKMYQKIESDHKKKSFSLEVIKENKKALHIYEVLGFKIRRDLISVQGMLNINTHPEKNDYRIKELASSDELGPIRLFHPSFENSSETLMRFPEMYELHELRKEGTLLAYAIYQPKLGSLKEIGATYPIEEHLDQLFLEMKINGERVRVMNIDGQAKELISYFCDRDLHIFVSQYEMIKN